MANRGRGGIVVRSDELHVLVIESEVVDGFLDEVGVLIAHMPELDGRDPHEEDAAGGMTVTGGLEPSVVGVPINLLLERVEDADPRIGRKSCAWNRHKYSSRGPAAGRARWLKIPVRIYF